MNRVLFGRIALLALLYFVLGHVSFLTTVAHSIVTPVFFIPEGVALAAAILFGPRVWPGIFMGQLALALSRGLALEPALAISAINSIEAVIAVLLLRRWGVGPVLSSFRDVSLLLLLIFLVLQPFSATLGIGVLWGFGVIPSASEAFPAWLNWWLGNAMGQSQITPLLLMAFSMSSAFWRALRKAALPLLLLLPAVWLEFSGQPTGGLSVALVIFVPLLFWIADRGGIAAVSLASSGIAMLAITLTGRGFGPFVVDGELRFLDMNVFILGLALTAQLFSMILQDRRKLHDRLVRVTAQVPGTVYQLRQLPDGSFNFPYVSEGVRALIRLTPEAVREDASKVFALVHPEDAMNFYASIKVSAQQQQPWRHRFRLHFPDGTERWLQGNALPQAEAHGGCLWHGFIADVTEEVIAEDKLRLSSSVFANSQEGIIITDAGGFITDVNPAFTRITGYAREEVLGRSPSMLSSGHQDADFFAQMWQSLHETGAWRGEVWNRNKAGEVYPELLSISEVKDGSGMISHYIGSFSDITNLKEREAQLDRIAHFDPLTGLPNRRLLGDRLQQALAHARRAGKIMAVCVLDLDNFKPINDSLGHAAGDAVLVEVARRLAISLRENDTVARVGGDEFVLLLQNLEWVEECDSILARILKSVVEPCTYEGKVVTVSASMGITLYPQDNSEADVLLRNADQAMYIAKQSGRNQYRLFDAEHDRLVRDYRKLLEDLAVALEKDQFILYYQPKVDMAFSRMVGAEALVRWRHPERGLLLPAEFLYVIEGSELEIPFGEWVLQSALQQAVVWQAQAVQVPVSVNLSVGYLLQTDFPEHLAAMLARYPTLSSQDLEIEILESSALQDIERITNIVKSCQKLGVRVALDDFGKGFSSLAYFKHLPVDILKIDQTFIQDMQNDPEDIAIVEGVIRIAEAFNRDVVAEGVETLEQGALLIYLGCRRAQGFAIARPMPPESLPQWAAEWTSDPGWLNVMGTSLAREDITLAIAESVHREWVNQLTYYLKSEVGELPPPPNGNTCRFGSWIEGHGRTRYQHLTAFNHLASLHQQLHDLGDELVAQHVLDPAAAFTQLESIHALGDQITDAIGALISELLIEETEIAFAE